MELEQKAHKGACKTHIQKNAPLVVVQGAGNRLTTF